MIYHGDCLEVLKTFKAGSIDALVTDPPAGISFMGKQWDSSSAFIRRMTDIFDECYRVLKPGAHGFIWALPRTSHWTATALEDAGFEIRDVVTHLFGSGFPKSLDISKAMDKAAGAKREIIGDGPKLKPMNNGSYGSERPDAVITKITAPSTSEAKRWEGWGTALKPASEHWILVRKPISEKTVAANVLKHGTGGINIHASRIAAISKKDLKDIRSERLSTSKGQFAVLTKDDKLDRSNRSHITGRFPANLILDEAAAQMLDEQSGNLHGAGNKRDKLKPSPGGYNGITGERNPNYHPDFGGASRFFYCAKTSKNERNAGCEGLGEKNSSKLDGGEFHGNSTSKNRMALNHHPTVKPKKLMSYLINMITPPGGLVLDPFMGSGSTGVACAENGFQFIGIEKEKEYFEIAEKRIHHGEIHQCLL